jgi:endonuclease YncB( thermonuclease family)
VQKKIFLNLFFLFLFNTVLAANEIKGLANIIDGDTLHIAQNKIRLNGIDAPEKKQLCAKSGNFYDCGLESMNALIKEVSNNPVICKTEKNKDRYGRFLGTCYIDQLNLNKWMVRNGHAIAYRKYSKDYIEDEQYAEKNKLGLWSGYFLDPEKWRKLN